MNERKVITPKEFGKIFDELWSKHTDGCIYSPPFSFHMNQEDRENFKSELIGAITKAKKEWEKEDLTKFLYWLVKHGYCDDDVYFEPPTAIDRYLILKEK